MEGLSIESITLSSSAVVTLKRVFLNLLSGRPEWTRCQRAFLKSEQVPERFLIERKWAIRGEYLEWQGSESQARTYLEELMAGSRPSKKHLSSTSPSTAGEVSPDLMQRIVEAIEREEKPPGVWSFPCVFRFSAAEFQGMFRFKDDDLGDLQATLQHAILTNLVKTTGKLGLNGERGFIYVRE